MASIVDSILGDGGCADHVEAMNGEPVVMLSGPDAGRTFTAVIEHAPDQIISGLLGEDSRGKRNIRFRDGRCPVIASQEQLQTGDGKIWLAVKTDLAAYLTTDFELREYQ